MDDFVRPGTTWRVRIGMHDGTMTDRTRIILIFTTVAAVCAGAGYYFFKVHQPSSRLADAREEIASWEVRWIAARDCLLGKTPMSSKVSEALAIRELAPDPWERKTCTSMISKLSRGDATDTRVTAVEAAWPVLDKAASKVAMSFLSHVDPDGDGLRPKPDPLPVALDELEAAHAALRRAAELPPIAAPTGTAPLAPVPLVAIEAAGKRVLGLVEPYMTSRSGLLAFGTIDGAEIQLQLVAGKPAMVTKVGAGMQRAIPDTSWGARAIPDGIEVGAIDEAGTLTAPTMLAVPGSTQVIAVVGTLADGVVVYGGGTQLFVARGKAGVFTPGKSILVRSMAFATDAATGDTAIAWTGMDDKTSWLRLSPSTLDAQPDELGAPGYVRALCLAKDTAFVETMDRGSGALFSAGLTTDSIGDGDAEHHTLIGCTDTGALGRRRLAGVTFLACAGSEDCKPVEPGTQRDNPPMAVVPGGAVAVEARGGVLAMRTRAGSTFHAVPNGFVPLSVITDGATVDVLGWSADGLVIARLPART